MKYNRLVPFTKTDYPNGYSRNDCQTQLDGMLAKIQTTRKKLKTFEDEAKELAAQLKRGGVFLEAD